MAKLKSMKITIHIVCIRKIEQKLYNYIPKASMQSKYANVLTSVSYLRSGQLKGGRRRFSTQFRNVTLIDARTNNDNEPT